VILPATLFMASTRERSRSPLNVRDKSVDLCSGVASTNVEQIDELQFTAKGITIRFSGVHNEKQAMIVSTEVALRLTGGMEPSAFRGLCSRKVCNFPVAAQYRLLASDLTCFDVVSSLVQDRGLNPLDYFLVSPEAVFNFDTKAWMARGCVESMIAGTALEVPLIYVAYTHVYDTKLFLKLGFRNHPKFEPLDYIVGYIEKKSQQLALTDHACSGVFIIPVTSCTSKTAETLLKHHLLNTKRFLMIPSDRDASLDKESLMLEYFYVEQCCQTDLADELRVWSQIPLLEPFRCLSRGGSDLRKGVRKLETQRGHNVTLADILIMRNVDPSAHAEWQARRAQEEPHNQEERRAESERKRLAEDQRKAEAAKERSEIAQWKGYLTEERRLALQKYKRDLKELGIGSAVCSYVSKSFEEWKQMILQKSSADGQSVIRTRSPCSQHATWCIDADGVVH
jgi:hypothetical protein